MINGGYMKKAFTLSEVLITLGIIGVVAALTIPTVINKQNKVVVESHLKKFYSEVNQALNNYIAVNGDLEALKFNNGTASFDENLRLVDMYLLKYIKYSKVEKCKISNFFQNAACVYLYNGDSFAFAACSDGVDIPYCVKCDVNMDVTKENPKKKFWFQFNKRISGNGNAFASQHSIDPYSMNWNGTVEDLKNNSKYGCRKNNSRFEFCAKYIQQNGWKIPDDYPW